MQAKFISHPDFAALEPIYIYHKQHDNPPYSHPAELINKHIIYRRKAVLGGFQKATLKISADDYYKLYVNGKYVTEGPASAYHTHYFYNEIDLTDYLAEGENTFAVHTFYQGLIGNGCVSGDLRQMLWLELALDGQTVLVSDESWKCKYHTGYIEIGRYGYDTAIAECYDASSPDTLFWEPDFDDSAFIPVKEKQHAQWELFKQTTKQIHVYEMKPNVVRYTDYGAYVELPSEAVGSLTFTAKGNRGDEVIIRCGEELNEDGSVRFDMRCYCRYEEKMILSGGEDVMSNYDYKAFRYAELHFPKTVTVSNIKMRVRHYPFQQKFFYNTENEKLKAVLDLCVNTVKYGTQEYFIDCPTREKGAYLGDLMISGRAQAIVTGDTTLLKHVIASFKETSFICPGLITTSVCGKMQEIADYALELPAVMAWAYAIDGDLEFLKYMAPTAMGVYQYFKRYEGPNGLIQDITEKWNLVDWPENLRDGYDFHICDPLPTGQGAHNVMNAFWYGFKLAMEEIWSILGEQYDFGTENTKKGFMNAFYSEKTGLFMDTPKSDHAAVHSNLLPLLFGMADENAELKARIVDLIKEKKLTSMGVYMAYFALAALKRAGEYRLCEELACDENAWLNMIKEGATTTFEVWGKDQKWNTSLFHPWATCPAIIFADGVRTY